MNNEELRRPDKWIWEIMGIKNIKRTSISEIDINSRLSYCTTNNTDQFYSQIPSEGFVALL